MGGYSSGNKRLPSYQAAILGKGRSFAKQRTYFYHGAPVSEFFSGAMADVLKADDNQTGTAALGSSREPLF